MTRCRVGPTCFAVLSPAFIQAQTDGGCNRRARGRRRCSDAGRKVPGGGGHLRQARGCAPGRCRIADEPRDGALHGGPSAEALLPLQKAVRLRPALAPASLFLGAALLDLGRGGEAVLPLQRAVTAMPQNADAREMLARAYFERSQFAKASVHYRMLTTMQPVNPKASYGLARTYEGIAEDALTALQRQSPDSPLIELVVADVAVTRRNSRRRSPSTGGRSTGPLPLAACTKRSRSCTSGRGNPSGPPRNHATSGAARRRNAPRAAPSASSSPAGSVSRWPRPIAECGQSLLGHPMANRRATDAVARLEKLPPSVELHLIRAELAQSRGRHVEAVTEVRAALALSPGNPTIETALAESCSTRTTWMKRFRSSSG